MFQQIEKQLHSNRSAAQQKLAKHIFKVLSSLFLKTHTCKLLSEPQSLDTYRALETWPLDVLQLTRLLNQKYKQRFQAPKKENKTTVNSSKITESVPH